MMRVVAAFLFLAAQAVSAEAGSLRFVESRPTHYDFVDIGRLPPTFGKGEFALEMWIKPDASYPVGPVRRGTYEQLRHWSDSDPEPYSSDGWWLAGNWLLDGHTRPRGYDPGDSREGTFSLQFYGGGRLRWMFADAGTGMPKGMVHAVQAWPAATTPSLLDGRWHHVVALRRWRDPGGAMLELWIDGRMIAATPIASRTDMRRFWNKLAHPDDPAALGGWALGSEVMTAWNTVLTQYEDYKGHVDDLAFWDRAPMEAEIAAWARGERSSRTGLLAHFSFNEGRGRVARDTINPKYELTWHRASSASWSRSERRSASSAPQLEDSR